MKPTFAFAGLLAIQSLAFGATISDRLVQNLDCRNITKKQIMAQLQPHAFGSNLHLGYVNWQSGYLGQCWSLSRFQRLTFYLHRDPREMLTSYNVADAADMVRGYSVDQSMGEGGLNPVQNRRIDYTLFSVRDLLNNYSESGREFARDIEDFQSYRFHQPSNLRMGLGKGALAPQENQRTLQRIIQNLDQGRLVLVNLRSTQTAQHIVVVKKYVRAANSAAIQLHVYDSNQPHGDQILWYNTQENQFISASIMGPFWAQAGLSPETPLGVFVVDENEMNLIETALVRYYSQACRRIEKR